MQENYIDKIIHNAVWSVIEILRNYARTFFNLIIKPRIELQHLLSNDNKEKFLSPGTFLVINILFADQIYGLPKLPIEISFLSNWAGNRSSIIIRFLLGITFFLFVLSRFLKGTRDEKLFYNLFKVICYASVIYIPNSLAKIFYSFIFDCIGFRIKSPFVLLVGLDKSEYILIILVFLIMCALAIWWLRLITIGLGISYPQFKMIIGRNVIRAYLIFFITQCFILSFVGVKEFYPAFQSIKMAKEGMNFLDQEPRNYYACSNHYGFVAEYEKNPLYIRYVSKLLFISCRLSSDPIASVKNNLLTQKVIGLIEDKNYDDAYGLLSEYIQNSAQDKTNVHRYYYHQLFNELLKADELRKSPKYVENDNVSAEYKFEIMSYLALLP